MQRKAIRLDDVAQAAGVSVATASRILSGASRSVPATVEAVRKAADRLGYHAPGTTEGRRTEDSQPKNSGSLAFVIPDYRAVAANTSLTMGMVNGISGVCGMRGVPVQMVHTQEDGTLPVFAGDGACSGLILKNWPNDERIMDHLPELPQVMCMYGPTFAQTSDRVQFDHDVLAEMVVHHFLKRGVSRIAAVTDNNQLSELDALKRVVASAQSAGLETHQISPDGTARTVATAEMVHKLLAMDPLPEIVFVYSTETFLPALDMMCRERKIKIGDGFEILPVIMSNAPRPAIEMSACIRMPAEAMGVASAETLLWRLANPDAAYRRVLITPEWETA